MTCALIALTREIFRNLAGLPRLDRGLREYLTQRVTLEQALARVRERVESREARLLDAARCLIYEQPRSPHRRLLEWAGCGYGDLVASVRAHGVEGTLDRLQEAGVFVSFEELKAKVPISRPGITIDVCEGDFDNPIAEQGVPGSTSGSRSAGTRIYYDWRGLAEEAENHLVLDAVHGVADAPLAIWFPIPPAVSGLRNVLIGARSGRPPIRWFSQTRPQASTAWIYHRLAAEYLVIACRRRGLAAGGPRATPLDQPLPVAMWLAEAKSGQPRVLRTITSSAVRVAKAAIERGFSLDGGVVEVGGEPLTAERRRYLEASGLQVVNRYATAEGGILGGACGCGSGVDDMHLYTDRVAAVSRVGRPAGDRDRLLLTSLSLYNAKVLFNTDLGDAGRLSPASCSCQFSDLGMKTIVSGLGSGEKLTHEGMNLALSDLDEIVSRLASAAGAGPDDHQIRTARTAVDRVAVEIVLRPEIAVDDESFRRAVLDEVARIASGGVITAELWGQAGTIRVVRGVPEVTRGYKQHRAR